MPRRREERALLADLDDAPEVHHGDSRRDVLDDRQVVGQHAAVPLVPAPGGKIEMIEGQLDVEAAGHRLESAQALGNDLGADAIAGDDRDAVCVLHREGSSRSAASMGASRGLRTTMATPTTVSTIPSIIGGVKASPNKTHAISAVQGGTR